MTSKLTLSGSLAIFNALSVVGLAVLARQMGAYQMLGQIWLGILSFPITVFCYLLLESADADGRHAIPVLCIAAGANALLWGHCVAWLLRRTLLARFAPSPSSPPDADDAPPGGTPPA